MLRKLLLAAIIALSMTAEVAAQNVGGRYSVNGTNPDGSAYSGTAEITVTSENTCRIVWRTAGTTSSGICMRNGNSFAAGYVMGKDVGLIIYDTRPDRSMRGIWTVADQKGLGTEVLTPQ